MIDNIIAEAIKVVFEEYVTEHGLANITEIFERGVTLEVGDMIPSSAYAERLLRSPCVG